MREREQPPKRGAYKKGKFSLSRSQFTQSPLSFVMYESVKLHTTFTNLTLKEDHSKELETLIRRHVKEVMTEKGLNQILQGHKACAHVLHKEGEVKGTTLLCHCGPDMVTTVSHLDAEPELTYILLWDLDDLKGISEEKSEKMETSAQE